MVAAAHEFDASYFDHPLASWWLELGARALTGPVTPIVVRLPFVVLSGVTSWLIFLSISALSVVPVVEFATLGYAAFCPRRS